MLLEIVNDFYEIVVTYFASTAKNQLVLTVFDHKWSYKNVVSGKIHLV